MPASRPHGVGHVVEADVHRDLVAVGVGEDQVGVHGRVQREDDAERDQADDDDDVSGRRRRRARGRSPPGRPRARRPARWRCAPSGSRPCPSTRRGRTAARTPARCRSRSPRPPGSVPTCQKLQPSTRAQEDRQADDEPDVARGEQEDARGGEHVDRAVVGEHLAELAPSRRAVPSSPRISSADDDQRGQRPAPARISSAGLEADERQQQAAEEEADALERVLRAGQDRDPLVERRLARPRARRA